MDDTRDMFGFRNLSPVAQRMLTTIRSELADEDRRTWLRRWRFGRRPERDRIIDAAFTLRRVVGEAAHRTGDTAANREPALLLMDQYLASSLVQQSAHAIIADRHQLLQLRGPKLHA